MKNTHTYIEFDNDSHSSTNKSRMRRISKTEKYNKYVIKKALYKNNTLSIYSGFNTLTNKNIIIKCEPKNLNCEKHTSIIDHEHKILHQLKNVAGVPRILDYYKESFSNSLYIDYLGKDLEFLMNIKKKFSIGFCAFVMCETIAIFRDIHNRNVYHCDVKPSNIVFNKSENKIYLIDFSVAQTKNTSNNCMIGTPKFCSYYCHDCIPYSSRDDLISLGYSMIYFFYGYLPWQKNKLVLLHKVYNLTNIKESKGNLLSFLKTHDSPEEFIIYFNYCFSLNKKDEIDYNMLQLLFVRLIKQLKYAREDMSSEVESANAENIYI